MLIVAALIFLHRMNVKKFRKEDQEDPNGELDFGLGGEPSAVSNFRKSIFGEKSATHKHQISMDMNMSTPYLLPPELHESRETLHTLAHSVQSPEDRYKSVGGSDVGSIRSARRGPGDHTSFYTSSSRTLASREPSSPPRMDLPRLPPAAADPFPRHLMHSPSQSQTSRFDSNHTTPPERHDPFMAHPETNQPHAQSTPYGDDRAAAASPPRIDIPTSTMPPTIDIALSPQERRSPPLENAFMP
ncbi:hypothetical protein IMZ48_41610, partial [Candidatus Bathyarchaeota archaeon]|nr:hypothetical protein [Candidatus Bathyarchaeota archaeon]